MKVLVNIFVFFLLLFVNGSFASENESNENEPKKIFQISYLKDVSSFKVKLNKRLESLRLDLAEKKYPQAYFIRSIQGQISEMNFRSVSDFKILEEQLFSLIQSVNSQSNANKSLSTLYYESDDLLFSDLSALKKQFQNENTILPTDIYSANDSDSHGFWKKIQATLNELTPRDEGVILLSFVVGYLILFIGRKISQMQVNGQKKAHVKNLSSIKRKAGSLKSETTQLDLSSMSEVLFCRVNTRDQVVSASPLFEKTFGQQNKWSSFLSDNFIKDLTVTNTKNLYQLKDKTDSRFFIQVSDKDIKNMKTVFMWDASWSIHHSDNAKNIMHTSELTFHDLIDDAIIKFQSFSKRMKIIGADELKVSVDNLNDISFKRLTENYIKIIFQVSNFKKVTDEIVLTVDETEKRCLMSAFIPGILLQPDDLKQKIAFGNGKNEALSLNKILRAMKTDHELLSVEFKVKNVFNSNSSGIYLNLSFDKEIQHLAQTKERKIENSSPI